MAMCMPQWIALIVLWGSLGVPEAKRIKPPSMAASMLDAMQDVSGSTPAVEEVLVAKAVRDSKPRDDDYWRETGALERCKRARIGRFIKQVVGIPVGVVVGGPAMFLSGSIGFSLLMMMDYAIASLAPSVFQVVVGSITYVGFTAVAVPTSLAQGQNIANFGVEHLPGVLGANGHHPACCCKDDFCALMGNTHVKWFQKQASCPESWEHDATQCVAPELLTYENETVSGCACKEEWSACAGNKLYRGHAWCEVDETADCGFKYKMLKKRRQGARWDYCRFAEVGMLENGTVVVNNSALAAFVPNLHKRGLIPRLPSANPWTLKTWVDGQKGVAIRKLKLNHRRSQCFAGTPVETLSGCAQKCLEEGAPNAKTMEGEEETTHLCKAMAYNRQTRLCVRLPNFASDAEFTPQIKSLDSKGWQNFKLDQ